MKLSMLRCFNHSACGGNLLVEGEGGDLSNNSQVIPFISALYILFEIQQMED